MQMDPLIISFFTQDWEYPAHAARLKRECSDLGLDNHIIEIPSTGSYRDNCRQKPFFILDSLEKFQQPVLWLDVDASIIRYPDVLLSDLAHKHDIAAVRKKIGLDHWYVGSIWFNHTTATKNLIDHWCRALGSSVDDGAFQLIYAKHKNEIKLLELDPQIHMILDRRQPVPLPGTCFAHRISKGESKQEEKRLSKKISRAKKHHAND